MLQGDHLSPRNFQRMYRLEVTGKMNTETTDMMMAPRCGMPDVIPEDGMLNEESPRDRNRRDANRNRPADFHAPGLCTFFFNSNSKSKKKSVFGNDNNNNGPNGHLFYVGGDLMMRRGMLPIIMLPEHQLHIVA